MAPAGRMPTHGPGGLVEDTTPKHPYDRAAQIRKCGPGQCQLLHEGEPLGRDQDVVEIGLTGVGFQTRETRQAVLIGKRRVEPAAVLGRQEGGDRLQHLVLERAASGDDQRGQ